MRSRSLAPLVLAAIGFAACSSKNDATPAPDAAPPDTRPPTPAAWDRPVQRPDDATAAQARASCQYTRGQMPAETLGPATAVDADIPITNVVVLMQENRSFDSYFGHLGVAGLEVAPASASNPDKAGGTTGSHPWQHAPHKCEADTDHSWRGAHLEYDDGKNDGFYEANQGYVETDAGAAPAPLLDGERALWFYDESDIPFHYALARAFAISDHYFSSILGPTWPNRMYLYGANSFGVTSNTLPDLTAFPYPDDGKEAVIFDELEKRHVDWAVYSDGSPGAGVILGVGLATRYDKSTPARYAIADFLAQAAAGTLPPVAFVDAKLGAYEGPDDDDEHPPSQIQIGQHFVWQIVNAVTHGPQWKATAMFLTYDENGGIYDHVPPPPACKPDDTAPKLEKDDVGTAGGFDRYGFRVPLVAISPYAKRGYVSHATYDHTSITRFIEAKFKLPALSGRDANADPFTDLFDWKSPPFVDPPSFPEPTIDQAEVGYCVQTYKQ